MKEGLLDVVNAHPRICIQMHNNPDADALTSAHALKEFLRHFNKESDIIYYGASIQQPSLVMFMNEYKVDCININREEDIPNLDYTLNILVDCQPGQGNVKDLKIKTLGVIDHHIQVGTFKENVVYSNINSSSVACVTAVWELYIKYKVGIDKKIGASLYYGLLKDSLDFTNQLSPIDRDMRDYLEENNLIEHHLINILRKENMGYKDLMTSQRALSSYNKDSRYESLAVIQASACEQNILGTISDTLIEVEGITLAVVFTEESESAYRLSIRSCDKFIKADDVIKEMVKGIGSGGGNIDKAAGVIIKDKFYAKHRDHTMRSLIESTLVKVYNKYEKIEVSVDNFDKEVINSLRLYKKLPKVLRYLELDKYFDKNDRVMIRTLEGDVDTEVEGNIALVGMVGEIHPISINNFYSRYTVIERETADCDQSLMDNKYKPKIKSTKTGKEVYIDNIELYPTCEAKPVRVKAVELTKPYKLITKWDKSRPYLGLPGDYLVIKDGTDAYIVNRGIFKETYTKVE